MMQGLAGLVRSRQTVWLTDATGASAARHDRPSRRSRERTTVRTSTLDRCTRSSCGRWEEVPGSPEICFMHAVLLPGTRQVLYWGYGDRGTT